MFGTTTARHKALLSVPVDRVTAEALSATQWRVCDRAVSPDDGRFVLGFIEQANDAYEAIRFGVAHAIDCRSFDTFSDALAFFDAANTDTSARKSEHREAKRSLRARLQRS